MSVKDIRESMKEGKVSFGIRQVLKSFKDKKSKKSHRVFVSKDAREDTIKALEDMKIEFEVLKNKEEIAKELGLGFESEVYLLK